MSMWEWAFLGAALLGIVLFCARVMRRGLTSLDADRARFLERLHATERRVREDRKNISAAEHVSIMKAAVDDLLRLAGNPEGYHATAAGRIIRLDTPRGPWLIELVMRERSLRTSGRILRGRSRWLLSGFDREEQHAEQITLMASLNAHLLGRDDPDEFPGFRRDLPRARLKELESSEPGKKHPGPTLCI